MRRFLIALLLPFALAACDGPEPYWAADELVDRARYRHGGQPEIVLFTMVSNSTGRGWHSGLMVNASQRVIFDPAGTYGHPATPERNDVFFGITNKALDFYIDYHARETYHVVMQRVPVSRATAEKALVLVQNYGAVAKAQCTTSITEILQQLDGFGHVERALWPDRAREALAIIPSVKTMKFFDDSPGDRSDLYPDGEPKWKTQ